MRKFLMILFGVLRFARQVRRTPRVRGRGKNRHANYWAFEAGKLLRRFLMGRR